MLLLLLPPAVASAQLPPLPKIKQFGIDGFRLMLQNKGLKATQHRIRTALDLEPEQTVAIILGDLRTVTRIRGQIEDFVNNGGALLIASDLRGMQVDRTPICGAWVRPTPALIGPQRTAHAYRKYADCPIVSDFELSHTEALFAGVRSIVANRPGEVDCVGDVRQIAWLPTPGNPPLMATYQQNSGRMLFVADHSIFINEMLVHGDNARFVNNVADWLCEGGKRSTLVLVNDGQVLGDWSFNATPPAIPLDKLVQAVQRGGLENLPIGESIIPIVNESLGRYQREDGFNRDARKLFQAMFGRRLPRVALLLITGLVTFRCARWLMTRARPPGWMSNLDWRQPREPKAAAAARGGAYFAYLRTVSREFFFESGANLLIHDAPPTVHPTQRKLIRNVENLWKIATGDRMKLSKSRFHRLLGVLREIRQLQLAGDLRLEWTPVSLSREELST